MGYHKWSDIKWRNKEPTPEEQEQARQRVINELKTLNNEYPNENYVEVIKELEAEDE